ncbi:MAG: hypothetical protein IJU12_09935 [Clostridia bacterium]|nr:hypothetical protein [Clostridia bacterium]
MKNWLEKIKGLKGGAWTLLLLLCAGACLIAAQPWTSPGDAPMTEEERRLSATLSRIAGAGEVRVSIYYAQTAAVFGNSGGGSPIGAVIVAQGAGDLNVRLNLLRAAETLLGLNASQVEVFPMEEDGHEG